MFHKGLLLCLLCLAFSAMSITFYSPSQLSVIHNRGYIRVGILKGNYPPFIIKNKAGQLTGLEIELVESLAELLQVKIQYDNSARSYDELLQNMYEKKDDIIVSGLVSIPSRATSVYFSSNYTVSPVGILVNRIKYDHLPANKLPNFDNANFKIGVLEASAFIGYIHFMYPKATIVTYINLHKLMQDVSDGKVDACMMDHLFIKDWLAQQPERAIRTRYITFPGFQVGYAIGTSYDYRVLGLWLDNFVQEAISIGFIDRLMKKYAISAIVQD
jgi:polar amino acid transport system substrate-binding protein